MELISQRELARRLDISPGTISDMVKNIDHRLVWVGKKINFDATLERLSNSNFGTKSREYKRRELRDAETSELKTAVQTGNVSNFEDIKPPGPPDPDQDYQTLEKIKLYEQARSLHIRNNVESGKYILLEQAQNEAFDIARKARNILQALAPRIRAIVPDDQKHDVEQLVIKEVNAALNLLADYCEGK